MKFCHSNGLHNCAGPQIRRLREQQQLSQEQLAAKLQLAGLNLSQKAISRVETGARAIPDYELIYYARALNTGVLELLGIT